MNPFTVLTSKIFGGVAVLLLVLLIGSCAQNGTLAHRIEALDTQIAGLTRDLTQCRANRITLEDATARQNAAVEAARAEGAQRLAALEQASVAARAAAQTAQSRAAAILARQPGADECADALALIREQ
jgi:cell division protein FtsB